MNVLVVDDEPLARELMEDNVSRVPFLKLAGSCSNGIEAQTALQKKQIDLVLLDIQMPGQTGIQFLQSLKSPMLAIFITAYEKYALEGYSLDVVDYLLKPVSFDRFLKAATKAHEIFDLRTRLLPGRRAMDFIFVQADYNLVKVNLSDVSHIEGLKDYVKIHLVSTTRPVITRMSMKVLEESLPAEKFMRVHKSFIISIDKIISIRKGRIKIGTTDVPLSDGYSEKFYHHISPVRAEK